MLESVTYFRVGPLSVLAWTGIIALASMIAATVTGVLPRYFRVRVHIRWHMLFAWIALAFGIIHGGLRFLAYF